MNSKNKINKKQVFGKLLVVGFSLLTGACSDNFLAQDPLSFYEPDKTFTTESGLPKTNTEGKTSQSNNQTKKVNINTATKEELDTLPGIGESTAQKIIDYRNKNGKFTNIEEIKEVSVIGESKYEKIKDMIFV